jgi:hypothetical protein
MESIKSIPVGNVLQPAADPCQHNTENKMLHPHRYVDMYLVWAKQKLKIVHHDELFKIKIWLQNLFEFAVVKSVDIFISLFRR